MENTSFIYCPSFPFCQLAMPEQLAAVQEALDEARKSMSEEWIGIIGGWCLVHSSELSWIKRSVAWHSLATSFHSSALFRIHYKR